MQKSIYFDGSRKIWQYDKNCVVFDEYLFYKPKIGTCNFSNIEFNTIMNFESNGRSNSNKNVGKFNGLVILGDSYAMGWGVEDSETYSALLGEKMGHKVYNLGVSSYGTYRELQSLERSGLLDNVNRIIINYSENDIFENASRINSDPKIPNVKKDDFDRLVSSPQMTYIELYKKWIFTALCAPSYNFFWFCSSDYDDESDIDFTPHIEPLKKILDKFPWIKDKPVLIFYTNPFGRKFRGFEGLNLEGYENITFKDLNIPKKGFFLLDDHMNRYGHKYVSEKLYTIYLPNSLKKSD